ncbi:TetR/AcrR family transcriptional regulator [Nocardia sp. CDC160]|uniref:TetR/AcrR family transcriptional regulator n=1 Tax=Nocardia sp. CDC160 TaxID=3112166 RepID=UPI002DBBDC94|nr:TetR/AcrR family transcriptional regulator [Nocardia sp. CDC160]MEC3919393.1 TetR/AcrR family transcriptional regulator [Nocardia sp. CDC160]
MTRDLSIDRRRLPRGTHGLDRETVEHSQRVRMYYGVMEAVAENGYAATTVSDIVARARVSRRTFYEMFRDRDDCFAAGFDYAMQLVHAELDAAVAAHPHPDWRDLLRVTFDAYLRVLSANPEIAYALHVMSLAAGPAVADQRRHMRLFFANRMRSVFRIARSAGDLQGDLPDEAFDALIGTVYDRIRECLTGPGIPALPTLTSHLYEITTALFGAPDWH